MPCFGTAGWRAPDVSDAYARIYAAVCAIPRGQVSTYGDVARHAGLPGRARQVGYALHALKEDQEVPWQRVINAQGRVSLGGQVGLDRLQQQMLEAEGVEFDAGGRVDLARFRWAPGPAGAKRARIRRAEEAK